MKKRIKIFVALLLALSLVLVACGGNGGTTEPADDTTETAPADDTADTDDTADAADDTGDDSDDEDAPAPPVDGVTEVSFFTWWGGGEMTMGEALWAEFEDRYPHIHVLQNYIPFSDYLALINTMMAAGNPPDVFHMVENAVFEWAHQGVAEDLAPHLAARGIDPFDKWIEIAVFEDEGHIWALAPGLGTTVLYYNIGMLEEAGITPPPRDAANPWTWDQYVEAAILLTRDVDGNMPGDPGFNYNNVVQWGTIMPNAWLWVMSLLYSADSSIADDAGLNPMITQPAGVSALQNMADLAHVHQVAPTLALTGHGALGSTHVMLMNDQLAMFVGGSWAHSNFYNEDYTVGIAQIPTMTGAASNMAWGAAFMMAEGAGEAAVEVILYMHDFNNWVESARAHEIALPLVVQTRSTIEDPALNAAWAEVFYPDLGELLGDILANGSRVGENVTLRNFDEIINQVITPMLDRIWLGELSAAEGMAEIEGTLEGLMEGVW